MTTRRLLLVEDEPDARDVLARSLGRAGWQVTAVGSAEEARALLPEAAALDALVFDVVLGSDERAGLELVAPFRRAAPRAPLVVITAFADLGKVKQALNDGASYLLEKPFAARDLLAVLQRLLEGAESAAAFVDRALARVALTDKEAEVARLVLKGLTSVEIARLTGNTDKTIRQHLTSIFAKCGVGSRAELFSWVFPS